MITLISRLMTAWPQVARRMIANWQLMSTVIVGVLLASAIMAGTVIYFDALRELALKNALIQLSVNRDQHHRQGRSRTHHLRPSATIY